MNNTHNKNSKISKIQFLFILLMLAGSGTLAYALAGKIYVVDSSHTQADIVALVTNEDTITNSSDADSETDVRIEQASNDTAEKYTPNIEITSLPDDPIHTTEILKPVETSTPTPAVTPTLTPSPSPSATPKPDICSMKFRYRIGFVDSIFSHHDFTRDNLIQIALYAESQWESALDADIFEHNDTAQDANVIEFASAEIEYTHIERGQFGLTFLTDTNNDGITEKFKITIMSQIFYITDPGGDKIFLGSGDKYSLEESIITRAVMHQMGHVLGLEHLSDNRNGVMAKEWIPSFYKPKLSEYDIALVKKICN